MGHTEDRFQVVHEEKHSLNSGARVLRDSQTGVLYLATWLGAGSGLTVLVDGDGRPLVDPVGPPPRD